jgi:hypothetical protein
LLRHLGFRLHFLFDEQCLELLVSRLRFGISFINLYFCFQLITSRLRVRLLPIDFHLQRHLLHFSISLLLIESPLHQLHVHVLLRCDLFLKLLDLVLQRFHECG